MSKLSCLQTNPVLFEQIECTGFTGRVFHHYLEAWYANHRPNKFYCLMLRLWRSLFRPRKLLRKARGCSTAIKSRNSRAFSEAHYFCIVLADKCNFNVVADVDDFFFVRDRSKIGMRCSSILLQRHGNLWGSSAFVVICLGFFIKLFVDRKKPTIYGTDPRLFWGCFGFWGVFFVVLVFLFPFFLWSVDGKIQERIKFREISEQCKCFLRQTLLF